VYWDQVNISLLSILFFAVAHADVSHLCSLAQCQLYFTIAAVARRFDFELFETTEEDIRVARDYITAFPKDGLFDVKVTVRSSLGD
jgi:hypothetical protein